MQSLQPDPYGPAPLPPQDPGSSAPAHPHPGASAPALTTPSAPPFVPDPSLAGSPAHAVEPFAPPSDAWRRVSPKLATVKRITLTIWVALLFVPFAVVTGVLFPNEAGWLPFAIGGVGLVVWGWLFVRAGRFVRSLGWARRDKDLCVVRGLMVRTLEVVPFGRMQVAKVTSGPLQRAFGLSNVELVTASVGGNAVIPGLPADEATALRDLIIELSDAEGSGL